MACRLLGTKPPSKQKWLIILTHLTVAKKLIGAHKRASAYQGLDTEYTGI